MSDVLSDAGLSAPRRVASWTVADEAARETVVERLAAILVAAARDAGFRGAAWLDSGGPSCGTGSESVITAFPVARARLSRDETRDVPALLQRIGARDEAVNGGIDARFRGGWIGLLGYEAAEGLEPIRLRAQRDLEVPLAAWGLYPTWFRVPFEAPGLELWSRLRAGEDADSAHPHLAVWKRWAAEALAADAVPLQEALDATPPASRKEAEALVARGSRSFAPARFEAAVRAVQDAVREGEVFQANIAHRVRVPTHADPFAAYLRLRRLNPSPFALYLEEDWGALCSNSPERLFAVRHERAARWVEARPIAGTRPRGETEEEDARHAAELIASSKERAEHTMLVDLARNDVARVATRGSVRVGRFQEVERYSHVHHLVSRVTGCLREDVELVDLARALFPGGTITGAPKLRSMEVIDRIEAVARGPYTGSAGYVNPDGSMDWNILIRTLVFTPGEASAYAGAGIVADSVPAHEYDETLHKAAAMLVALATAERTPTRISVPVAASGGR